MQITIPQPVTPATDPMPLLDSRIFDKEIDIYMKRRSTLEENVQKCYSLVLSQCTDLLKSKLKQSHEWHAASTTYDVLILIRTIRTITPKFDDQKYMPLELYQEKKNLYNIRQGSLSNAEYFEKSTTLSTSRRRTTDKSMIRQSQTLQQRLHTQEWTTPH